MKDPAAAAKSRCAYQKKKKLRLGAIKKEEKDQTGSAGE